MKIHVGSLVQVRLLRRDGGTSKCSPDHSDYAGYPKVWCRVAMVGVGGVPDIFALEYEDGHPVGLPFREIDFLKVKSVRKCAA